MLSISKFFIGFLFFLLTANVALAGHEPDPMSDDYYERIGADPLASQKEIKQAILHALYKYSEDKYEDEEEKKRVHDANINLIEARKTLGYEDSRREYNKFMGIPDWDDEEGKKTGRRNSGPRKGPYSKYHQPEIDKKAAVGVMSVGAFGQLNISDRTKLMEAIQLQASGLIKEQIDFLKGVIAAKIYVYGEAERILKNPPSVTKFILRQTMREESRDYDDKAQGFAIPFLQVQYLEKDQLAALKEIQEGDINDYYKRLAGFILSGTFDNTELNYRRSAPFGDQYKVLLNIEGKDRPFTANEIAFLEQLAAGTNDLKYSAAKLLKNPPSAIKASLRARMKPEWRNYKKEFESSPDPDQFLTLEMLTSEERDTLKKIAQFDLEDRYEDHAENILIENMDDPQMGYFRADQRYQRSRVFDKMFYQNTTLTEYQIRFLKIEKDKEPVDFIKRTIKETFAHPPSFEKYQLRMAIARERAGGRTVENVIHMDSDALIALKDIAASDYDNSQDAAQQILNQAQSFPELGYLRFDTRLDRREALSKLDPSTIDERREKILHLIKSFDKGVAETINGLLKEAKLARARAKTDSPKILLLRDLEPETRKGETEPVSFTQSFMDRMRQVARCNFSIEKWKREKLSSSALTKTGH